MRVTVIGIATLFSALASPSLRAVTITPDYSSLGTVYQDAAGNFFSAAGAGRTDVTNLFKTDVSTSIGYLQNAVQLPWNLTITFKLAALDPNVAGDSVVNTIDGDNRPKTSTIRFSTDSSVKYFIDPTPTDNSEFSLTYADAALGGGNVNNKRFGDATMDGGAKDRADLLTLILHESVHSLGISSSLQRFLDKAGASNAANRKVTIPKALSGLTNDFDIPITTGSAHFDGSNATFNFSSVSDPGWGIGQRALPTALDILALGEVEGAAANQLDVNLPEPAGSLVILMSALAISARRRRAR
jgi:hypothetical protein